LAPDRLTAYDQAVKLLTQRTHFRREIETKLAQRSYSSDEIGEAVERLLERRYLDDAEAAREYAGGRLSRGGYGRARLQAELSARGVDRETADGVLDELLPDDDLEAARHEAIRVGGRARSDDPEKVAAKVARRLESRGFSRSSIYRLMDERPWESS
jgi:regulatory protein